MIRALDCLCFMALGLEVTLYRHGLMTDRLDDLFTWGVFALVMVSLGLALADVRRQVIQHREGHL